MCGDWSGPKEILLWNLSLCADMLYAAASVDSIPYAQLTQIGIQKRKRVLVYAPISFHHYYCHYSVAHYHTKPPSFLQALAGRSTCIFFSWLLAVGYCVSFLLVFVSCFVAIFTAVAAVRVLLPLVNVLLPSCSNNDVYISIHPIGLSSYISFHCIGMNLKF